jgi:putative acetyltransferase
MQIISFALMTNIRLTRTNSNNPDFKTLVTELDAALRERNGDVMDLYDRHNVIEQNDTVVIAYLNEEPAGCGCFKTFDKESIEIKRMYVRPAARGMGISKLVLAELEAWAKELSYKYAVLETGTKQAEALNLYPKAGYQQTDNYGPYANLPDSVCFKKVL